jgi:hypothetical protein
VNTEREIRGRTDANANLCGLRRMGEYMGSEMMRVRDKDVVRIYVGSERMG